MSEQQWVEANRCAHERVPRLSGALAALVLVGAIAFVLAARHDGLRAWQAYWVNFLFWSGLAQAGVVLAAIVHVARGRWGGTIVRLGLLQVAFLPVMVVLYVGVALMAGRLLPWVAEPVAGKQWWLDLSFFVLRDGIGLAVLCGASVAFAYYALRPEMGTLREQGAIPYPQWVTKGWRGTEAEQARSARVLSWLAPLLIFLYAVVYTLLGFDMIMSLDPHWYSTLFGAYYFITTIYLGLAALVVIAAVARRLMGLHEYLTSKQFHDLGKLLFAFCLLSGDFFWSQFLVIWYGDLPEEVRFVLHRIENEPWRTLCFIVLFGGFVIPFVILLNRKVKQIPATLAAVALLILACGFAERLLMILPSLHPEIGYRFPIGVVEFLISGGFAGLFGLSVLWAMRNAPLVPVLSATEE